MALIHREEEMYETQPWKKVVAGVIATLVTLVIGTIAMVFAGAWELP